MSVTFALVVDPVINLSCYFASIISYSIPAIERLSSYSTYHRYCGPNSYHFVVHTQRYRTFCKRVENIEIWIINCLLKSAQPLTMKVISILWTRNLEWNANNLYSYTGFSLFFSYSSLYFSTSDRSILQTETLHMLYAKAVVFAANFLSKNIDLFWWNHSCFTFSIQICMLRISRL